MTYVEFACEGRLLFRTAVPEDAPVVPRLNEIVMVGERPYQVVDVEHWVRRLGTTDRRALWPTVHLLPLSQEEWDRRAQRRHVVGREPVRY